MNILKLKLNPYTNVNIVSLDDKPLSPYSELNNFMKEPFLSWASKLLETAEREINDDFCLEVISETFESFFLEGLQSEFDSCAKYQSKAFELNTPINERLETIIKLAEKYKIEYSLGNFKLPIYTDIDLNIDKSLIDFVSSTDAKFIISNDKSILNRLGEFSKQCVVLLLSDKNSVTGFNDEKYIWEIYSDKLNLIMNSIIDRFVKIPFIINLCSNFKSIYDNLSDEDKQILNLILEIDPYVSIQEIPKIEVGNSYTLKIDMFPSTSRIPNLRIKPQKDNIISVDGNCLTAVVPGITDIDIYKNEENIPFVRRTVTTYQNNFVKKIILSVTNKNIGIGKTQSINIQLTPIDADDVSNITWHVDNDSVISVDENGIIKGLNPGEAIVTAKTRNVSSNVEITVLPNINNLSLSINQTNLYVGETQPILINVEPKKCFDSSVEWKSSDETVAIVEKDDNNQTIIRAKGIGDCTLSCEAKEGSCVASCNVRVESTFKKKENIHTMLSFTAICAVACMFGAALSLKFICIIAAISTVLFGILSIFQNKADKLWAVILMIIAILALIY